MQVELKRRQRIKDGGYWLLFYSALWWLLAGGAGWGAGAVVIVAAALMSLWLGATPWRLRLLAIPRFLVFFLGELWLGGWDVARRALQPSRPLQPAWVVYSMTCTNEQVKLTLSAVVGLLPGTLSSHYEQDQLFIHTLDESQDWLTTVTTLERQLQSLLGVSDSGAAR